MPAAVSAPASCTPQPQNFSAGSLANPQLGQATGKVRAALRAEAPSRPIVGGATGAPRIDDMPVILSCLRIPANLPTFEQASLRAQRG